MMKKTFALAALLVLAAAPLAFAHDGHADDTTAVGPNTHCWSTQNPHDYGVPGDVSYTTPFRKGGVGLYSAGDYNTEDCETGLHPNDPEYDPTTGADFDGDYEYGFGGGFFPAGIYAADPTCDYGLVPHHGATFHVHSAIPDESTGFLATFTVGSDPTPPTLVPSTDPEDDDGFDCVTDGSVTPATDTDDCLDEFVHAGTTTCLPGGDGGWNLWISCATVASGEGTGNGIPDGIEDWNRNGIPDGLEDNNGNGIPDGVEDLNGNGIPDGLEDNKGGSQASVDCSFSGHIYSS